VQNLNVGIEGNPPSDTLLALTAPFPEVLHRELMPRRCSESSPSLFETLLSGCFLMLYLKRILVLFFVLVSSAVAQLPASFSWSNCVKPAGDQLRQGPCFTFAGVGTTEAMYRLFGGQQLDMSKRLVYSCANPTAPVADLPTVMSYLQNSGAIPAVDDPYPTGVAPNPNLSDNTPPVIVYRQGFDGVAKQIASGRRIKVTYTDVGATLRSNADAVKSLLINKGPIALNLQSNVLHGGAQHAYMLIGWKTVNGQLRWIFNDSWPTAPGIVDFALDLVHDFSVSSGSHAYIVNTVSEEHYSNGWTPYPIPATPYELDSANQIAKIDGPNGCFGRGQYTVSGLNLLPGATVVDWFLRSDYTYPGDASISSSGVVSGNAYNVTVVATVLRPNGMAENITKYVGTVGMPVRVDTVSSACYNGRREINLLARVPGAPGVTTTVSINIPPSTDGKYYTIPNGSYAVYINYNGTGAITYYVTVTMVSSSCSDTYSTMRYVVVLPCGY
jgi:papain like protease